MNRINLYFFFLLVLLLTITACQDVSNEIEKSAEEPQPMTIDDLLNKTIEYRYGDDVYHVTIDSKSELHWEAVAGGEVGVMEEETYKSEFIDSQKLFITWGEANGIGVSQILDFEKGIVHNHLLRGRNVSIGRGEISIIDN